MPSLRWFPLTGFVLVASCFSPGDSDTPQDAESESTAPSDSGDPSGPPIDSSPSDPSSGSTDDGPTSAADTSASETSSEDSTTGESECNDVDAPCPAGQYCVDNSYCDNPPIDMVAVPGGPFMMGCNQAVDFDCLPNEFPYHEVFLSSFAIDRTEVTAEAYADCVDAGACSSPHATDAFGTACDAGSGDLPATCVDWFQAGEYCEWMEAQLPTEAQWEKAARGTDGRLYPWGDDEATCDHVNMGGCMEMDGVIAVGSRPAGASPYGAFDMSGNVAEWVADWYGASYYVDSPAMDPPGPDEGDERYPRNAAFNTLASGIRSSFRGVNYDTPTPEDGNMSVGFRCAFVP